MLLDYTVSPYSFSNSGRVYTVFLDRLLPLKNKTAIQSLLNKVSFNYNRNVFDVLLRRFQCYQRPRSRNQETQNIDQNIKTKTKRQNPVRYSATPIPDKFMCNIHILLQLKLQRMEMFVNTHRKASVTMAVPLFATSS